jgi:hypothetical protein
VSGSVVGSLVASVLCNGLGQTTEINLNNGLRTTFGYWGTGGSYDTTGGYYGKLWEIKTLPQAGGTALQDVKHTPCRDKVSRGRLWDAVGSLTQRQDLVASETESFTYDYLDRLTGVSGPYTETYSFDMTGNILSKTCPERSRRNGAMYAYGNQPHAVTSYNGTSYAYDNNGNMTTRPNGSIVWDVENRPASMTINGVTTNFTPCREKVSRGRLYDGDGKRVKQAVTGGNTTIYVNTYYEKLVPYGDTGNVTTSNVTTYYFLGNKLVAKRTGTTLNYVQQDHLSGTSLMTDSSGAQAGATMKYV